jgi:hypothetical protein
LKRLRTAPQGRGYRIKKRSNHVTMIVDSKIPHRKFKIKINGTDSWDKKQIQ